MRKSRKGVWPKEIFLSHSSKDRKVAARLAGVLRAHGVPVWYSESNLLGAQQWHDEIGASLARCDWFAVLLSPSATKSIWVKRELLYALRDQRYQDKIVPILHRECDSSKLSWTLADSQTVDFTCGFDPGCHQLLRVWGIGYKSV